MPLLKHFFYEHLENNPAEKYYIGLINRLEIYENNYSIEYFEKVDNIYKKYKQKFRTENNKRTDENKLLKYELNDYYNLILTYLTDNLCDFSKILRPSYQNSFLQTFLFCFLI